MKKLLLFLIFSPLFTFAQSSNFIHVDQFGYKTQLPKVAVISNPEQGFNAAENFNPSSTLQVRNSTTNAVVFTGTVDVWNDGIIHSQSGDRGWWYDFSNLTQSGDYYIYDVANDERSAIFTIQDQVYEPILIAATKAFYYNRSGIAKTTPYVANGFSDPISFTQDANVRDINDQNNTSTTKDMSGGWYDAGDFNKYVTFAEPAVQNLLWAYRNTPSVFTDQFNIPESGNGMPDILDEIKWELNWLLKMVNADGSVHIKMGSRNHNENVSSPPSANTNIRYYGPVCTSSAIAAAGILAHAAKVFEGISGQASFAESLKTEAVNAWNWVLPYINANNLQTNCDLTEDDTQPSVVAGDADLDQDEQLRTALSTAIYLFDLTGEAGYQTYITDHLNDTDVISGSQWSNYRLNHVDALLHYTTLANANASIRATILNSASASASNNFNGYFEFSEDDLYRAFTNDWTHHWGSNREKANFGNLNLVFAKHQINSSSNPTYLLKAKEQLHYFHGVNPLGIVYLSNMYDHGAEKSVNQMYHQWFNDGTVWDDAINSTYGPAPGFVPGGPNSGFSVSTLSPPYGQPMLKSYLDFNTGFPDNSWEITEPGIYYQAAYVRLIAGIVNLTGLTLGVEDQEISLKNYILAPNPVKDHFRIVSIQSEPFTLRVFNSLGQLIINPKEIMTNQNISSSKLSPGIYYLQLKNEQFSTNLKFIKK